MDQKGEETPQRPGLFTVHHKVSAGITIAVLGIIGWSLYLGSRTTAELEPPIPRIEVTSPGWATFGQVLPRGVAREGLRLGNVPTQTDIKNRWPDGSIKLAIVSANIPQAGSYLLTSAQANSGSFAPQSPRVSAQFNIGGTVYTAVLPSAPTQDNWLSGPLVREWRTIVAPVTGDGTSHPFLRVIFDTRGYNDGQARVDVTFENVFDDRGDVVNYNVGIAVNGQSVFQRDNVNHYYLTRWRKAFRAGLTEAEITPDFEPFYRANAVPRYLPVVSNDSYDFDLDSTCTPGDLSCFNILGAGDLNPYMPDHGTRPEYAPYPDWAARYLVHKTRNQREYLLINGDLGGSWPVHVREPDGGLVSVDARPDYWLDVPSGRGGDDPRGNVTGGTGRLIPDIAHQPSLAYLPYLVTGDRYYADEMELWANYVVLGLYPPPLEQGGRDGSRALLWPEQVRGQAWGLRNIVDAAAYLPDQDPMKAYFTQKVVNNLEFYDNYTDTHSTPLGTYFEGQTPGVADTGLWYAIVAHNNFVAWALDHAVKQGFSNGGRLRDRLVAFSLRLFTSGQDFPRNYAGTPHVAIGFCEEPCTVTYRVTSYFTNMRDVFEYTYGNPPYSGNYHPPHSSTRATPELKRDWL